VRSRVPVACLAVVVLSTGCGPDHDAQPTVPSVDFTPRAAVVADDDGVACRPPDGCTLPAGSVVAVRNEGSSPRRLRGDDGRTFDTGELRPGEQMTLVVGRSGEGDGDEIVVSDPDRPGQTLTIVVLAPGAG